MPMFHVIDMTSFNISFKVASAFASKGNSIIPPLDLGTSIKLLQSYQACHNYDRLQVSLVRPIVICVKYY